MPSLIYDLERGRLKAQPWVKVLISNLDIELHAVPGDPFLPFCQHVQVAIVTQPVG